MERITAEDNAAAVLPPSLRKDRFFSSALNGAGLWMKLAELLGINPKRSPKALGTGTRGTAYELGNRALKITIDHTEARAAAIIRDNPDPAGRIVKVTFVIILEGRTEYSQSGQTVSMPHPGFAIVMERLEKPDAIWGDMVDLWPTGRRVTIDNVEEFLQEQRPPRFRNAWTVEGIRRVGSWCGPVP